MADKAVLCGINDYQSISDLRGCVNDVHNVSRLLKESLGFESNDIKIYLNDEVTKSTVSDAFRWLADGAQENDRLIFHFSGHGSYTPSENSDEEVDELICLHGMDWEDSDSYLIDDDLGKLTRLVKFGRLTVILDCCFSGTGTRAITANFGMARTASPKSRLMVLADTAAHLTTGRGKDNLRRLASGNPALMRSFRDNRAQPVLARFVEPPAKYRAKPDKRKIKRLGTTMRAALNHQLLAGARDDQTAADAFIAGEYNGAFSYYLCDTVRNLGIKSYDEIMLATVDTVKSEGYSQIPQNEGPFGREAIFGGSNVSSIGIGPPASDSTPIAIESCSPVKSLMDPSGDSEPLTLLSDLLRVAEKLIDISSRESRLGAPLRIATRLQSNEVVVYVHGISQHHKDYSVPWYNAMRPHLTHDLQRAEVLWSPHVNSRSGSSRSSRDVTRLAQEIEQELMHRTEALERQISTGSRGTRLERPRGSGFSVDDFARYMLIESTREAILQEFYQAVRPLLSGGRKLHIIGHSWGTVVSFEGLRRMDGESFSGRVANLFVVGSALSISAVQSNLFGRVTDGRRPKVVDRIINLDAGGDIVGGPIGDHFTVNREFLGLEPVGCATIPFTEVALNPSCAHSSYFNPDNDEVNRGIFAQFISYS